MPLPMHKFLCLQFSTFTEDSVTDLQTVLLALNRNPRQAKAEGHLSKGPSFSGKTFQGNLCSMLM